MIFFFVLACDLGRVEEVIYFVGFFVKQVKKREKEVKINGKKIIFVVLYEQVENNSGFGIVVMIIYKFNFS